MADWIIGHFPKHRVYVEPFGGGAGVLLQKPRSPYEVYNDLDGEVVNLFRVMRDRGQDLVRLLEMTPYARDEFDFSYQSTDDPLEQARRTVVRVHMCFGTTGMRRHNTGFRTVSGNSPAMQWMGHAGALWAMVERLRGVIIENREAVEVMRRHDADDVLHYVDPPYVLSTRGENRDYRHEMDDAAHEQLADVLHGLKGAVILSGYDCQLYGRLYGDWRKVQKCCRIDGGVRDPAQTRVEVLWLSPKCPRAGLFDAEDVLVTNEGEIA
jgi:DNA adenine methylase